MYSAAADLCPRTSPKVEMKLGFVCQSERVYNAKCSIVGDEADFVSVWFIKSPNYLLSVSHQNLP